MVCEEILRNSSKGKCYLRALDVPDCTDEYLKWLNDERINRYLETRWEEQSLSKIISFVNDIRNSTHSYLFAIISTLENKHIGNIKLGPIHPHYPRADISYFIGEVSCWGKGYATEAISLVSEWAFTDLGLHKLQAGVFDENKGSIKALKKAGFVQEACYKEELISPVTNKYCDHLFFGKINPYQKT